MDGDVFVPLIFRDGAAVTAFTVAVVAWAVFELVMRGRQRLRAGGPAAPDPSFAGLLARAQESLGRLRLLLGLDQFVTCNRAWSRGSLLHAVVGALGRRNLRFRLRALRVRRLDLRFCFRNLSIHFWSSQFDEQISFFDDAAAIDQHARHIS